MIKKGHKVFIGIGITVILMLGVYFFIAQFFSTRFFYHTQINHIDCSFLTAEEANTLLNRMVTEYDLNIVGREDLEINLEGDVIDLEVIWNQSTEEILQRQNKYVWLFAGIKGVQYEFQHQVIYDDEKLKRFLYAHEMFSSKNMTAPSNAQIGTYDENEGMYQIIPALQGNYVSKKKVYAEVKKAILKLENEIDIDELNCYLKPIVDDSDTRLCETVDRMNQMVSSEITYHFGEKTEILDKTILHEWISNDGYVVKLAEEKVSEYVKNLAKQYDTAYRKHDFVTAQGNHIVVDKGFYGWWMNKNGETQELTALIEQGAKTVKEPVYIQKAASYDKPDYGDTYIELDLTMQHLYLWVNGTILLESDFVSGNMVNGNATPEGIFPITYKERNATLRGDNYANFVSYWMPFNGGIGLHDASWRHKFGGTIYMRNGSHGCINLPVDIASQIYEQVYTGMPVICYYNSCELIQAE